jgi:hypothetical protein
MDQQQETGDAYEVPAEQSTPQGPPPGSTISVDRFPDGLTITVPPAGLKGAKGLFFFAVVWDVIVVFITAMFVIIFVGGNQKQDAPLWVFPLFMSIFWLVGLGVTLGAINMARRRAALAVTGGTLMVLQTGIFGSKQRDWPPGEVSAVCVGPTGMTVNDVPIEELQIYDRSRHKFGLLAGRTDEELHWLTNELRTVLGLHANFHPVDADDESDELNE